MKNKKLVLVVLSSVLCCMTSWSQPTKNSYSAGIGGNFFIENGSNSQLPNAKNSRNQAIAVLNTNYYFSNSWYAGITYDRAYSHEKFSNFSTNNNQYYKIAMNSTFITNKAGIGVGYYKLIAPKVLFMLSINCNYGKVNSNSSSIQNDSSSATNNNYVTQKNDYSYKGYNYSVNVIPNIQFLLTKNWAIGISLANIGYNYSNVTANQTNVSFTSTNGNITSYSYNYSDTKKEIYNRFSGSIVLNNLVLGVNYYFNKPEKKIEEAK